MKKLPRTTRPNHQRRPLVRVMIWLAAVVSLVLNLESASAQNFDTNGVSTANTYTNPAPPIQNLYQGYTASTNYLVSPELQPILSEVPSPVPTSSIGTGALSSPLTGTSAIGVPAGGALGSQTVGRPIYSLGPFDFHVLLGESFAYSSDTESTPGHKVDTWVDTVSPGMTMSLGTHWILTYTPSIAFYSQSGYSDTLNQAVSLAGFANYQDWTFTLGQNYGRSSEPLIETGVQTSEENYGTALGIGKLFSDSLSWQLSLNQEIRSAASFSDDDFWSIGNWVNYRPFEQLSVGFGVSGGYDEIGGGVNTAYEAYQGSLFIAPSDKLTLSLTAGINDSQFINSSASDLLEPIFSGSLNYRLTRTTTISLSGSRSVSPSFYTDQVIVETQFGGSLNQMLFHKLSLNIAGGYVNTPYTAVAVVPYLGQYYGAVAPNQISETLREDTTTYISATLSYPIGNRFSAAVFFSRTQDDSSQSGFAYSSLQGGVSIRYAY